MLFADTQALQASSIDMGTSFFHAVIARNGCGSFVFQIETPRSPRPFQYPARSLGQQMALALGDWRERWLRSCVGLEGHGTGCQVGAESRRGERTFRHSQHFRLSYRSNVEVHGNN